MFEPGYDRENAIGNVRAWGYVKESADEIDEERSWIAAAAVEHSAKADVRTLARPG
jgi:hypothetical protein